MPLRRTSVTPAGLHARRLNSLKSTGPRSARGKAWSCLNAVRHGQRSRRRTFRDKLVRTGDSEAVYLFDFIFEELLNGQENPSDFVWRRLESLAVRAWCIESGRRGRKVAKTCLRTKLESGVRVYRYTEKFVVPRRLKITNKAGLGFVLINPAPSRRRRVAEGWIPEVLDLEGEPPRARRVRGGCKPGTEIVRFGENRACGDEVEPRRSPWEVIRTAAGRLGGSILRMFGLSGAVAPVSEREPGIRGQGPAALSPAPLRGAVLREIAGSRRPVAGFETDKQLPVTDNPFWDDPEDHESESREEAMLRDKFIAMFTEAAARVSRKA